MNSKLHAITDAACRPLRMFLTAGQRSDYIGAPALLDAHPPAEHMLADRGNDADWCREALENKGSKPCIPSRKNRKVPISHDEARYRKRHKIENSFARLKDWRRVTTRYDRCPNIQLSFSAPEKGLRSTICQDTPPFQRNGVTIIIRACASFFPSAALCRPVFVRTAPQVTDWKGSDPRHRHREP